MTGQVLILVVTLHHHIQKVYSGNTKECLSCDLIDDPRACFHVVPCDDNHYCSSIRVLTESGAIKYILECTAYSDCVHPVAELFGKRSGQLTLLDNQCCLTTYCNRDLYNSRTTRKHLATIPPTRETTTLPTTSSSNGILCYDCHDMSHPRDCAMIKSCAPHEICSVTRYSTHDGHAYYDSACKARTSCGVIVSGRKKKSPTQLSSFRSGQSPDNATCNLCCDTDFCNKELCDIPTNATNHLKRCLKCDLVDDPKSCNHVIGCGTDQFCSTEKVLSAFGEVRFKLGCASLTECFVTPTSSTNEVILDRRCCKVEYCNRNIFDLMTTKKFKTTLPPVTVATTTPAPPTTTTLPKTSASTVPTSGSGVHCFQCDSVSDPTACYTTTSCAQGEYCTTTELVTPQGQLRYKLGCSNLAACHTSIGTSLGKRSQDTPIQTACCQKDLCNRDLLDDEKKKRTESIAILEEQKKRDNKGTEQEGCSRVRQYQQKIERKVTSETQYEVDVEEDKREWRKEKREEATTKGRKRKHMIIESEDEEMTDEVVTAVETLEQLMNADEQNLTEIFEELEEPEIELEEEVGSELAGKSKDTRVVEVQASAEREETREKEVVECGKDDHVEEYDPETNGAGRKYAYIPTPVETSDIKLQKLQEVQYKVVILNVGGSKFEVATQTLFNVPGGLLAKLMTKVKPLKKTYPYEYFVCRDATYFPLVLRYLRGGCKISQELLPSSIQELMQCKEEAEYYDLEHLALIVTQKILVLRQSSL